MSVSTTNSVVSENPEYIIYCDVSEDDMNIHHQQLLSGENVVSVPREGIYLIGFGETTENGGIKITGSLQTIDGDLESFSRECRNPTIRSTSERLPSVLTSTPAQSPLLIFPVTSDTTNRSSQIFGKIDGAMKSMLSPDIDGNGVFDSEENISWGFHAQYIFSYTAEHLISPTLQSIQNDLEKVGVNIHMNISYGNGENVAGDSTWARVSLDRRDGNGFEEIALIDSTSDWQWSFYDAGNGYNLGLKFGLIEMLDPISPEVYAGNYPVGIRERCRAGL